MSEAIVLLSGGMDSTTLLYFVNRWVGYRWHEIRALGFHYGQVHMAQEMAAAATITSKLHVEFAVANLAPLDGALTRSAGEIPAATENRQSATVVHGRNAVLLSYAAAFADRADTTIFFGACYDDFRSYGDCRPQFFNGMSQAFLAAYGVGIAAPFVTRTKVEIVALGLELSVPYELTYSCYRGGKEPCMECDACVERLDAMEANGVDYYGRRK